MTTFSDNKLPLASQPWGREVTKAVTSLESKVESERINNTARDNQLNSSIIANQAATVKAQEAADSVTAVVNNIYSPGTTELDGAKVKSGTLSASKITTGTLDASSVSVTNLNASNITTGSMSAARITAGTMSGDRITGGTITGTTITGGTLSTSGSRHVEVSGTNVNFYDSLGNYSGRISAAADGRSSTVEINTTSGSGVIAYNGGVDINGPGTNISSGNNGNGSILLLASGGVDVSGALRTTSTVAATGAVSGSSFTTSGACLAGSFSTTGNLAASGLTTLNGDVRSQGIYDAITSQVYNVHIQGSANNYKLYRSTAASSRDYKRDIRELKFDSDAYIGIKPVVFKYNEGILREEEKDWDIIGFIAEDFENAGFGEQLVVQPGSEEETVQLRYDKMYMFLHKVVAEQHATIKSLTARIEALESKV